jgi:EAL domain-containing protein (putative c-di-GMP-specific phosphodiesterase class I)
LAQAFACVPLKRLADLRDLLGASAQRHRFECVRLTNDFRVGRTRVDQRIMSVLDETGLSPHMVTLEVTENQFVKYSADVLEVLSRLRIKGFRLSVDDFGTGATSFEQLRLYPFSELKLDRIFVQDVLTDSFARLAVATSLKLARLPNMSVVAEGVETQEQLDYFRKAGATFAQGYLIARPLAGQDVMAWLQENHGQWTSPVPDQPDADAQCV